MMSPRTTNGVTGFPMWATGSCVASAPVFDGHGLCGSGVGCELGGTVFGLGVCRASEALREAMSAALVVWAPSQFETWDPKPGRVSGGPFRSIPTKLPGVHFSELLKKCATIADQLAVVRNMKTNQSEHLQGINLLNRGAGPRPPFVRPTLGSVLAQQLGHLDNPVPNFILLDPCPEGNEFKEFKAGNWAGWLGAQYAPVRVGGDYKIENVARLADVTSDDFEARNALRRFYTKKI